MKKIEFCIAAFVAFSACAEERITYPASDGVNEVTARVRDDGVVIPESVTLAYVEPPPREVEVSGILPIYEPPPGEKVTVYRLELHSDANGNEAAFVVGGDGVERPVVLVEPMEYKLLTERLDAVWQSFHTTADGRRKLHGKIERTEIDAEKREKVEVHADGYRHVETLPQKHGGVSATVKVGGANSGEPPKPGNISDRQWQMRKQLKVLKQKPAKAVTVEHDAVTGADIVKGGAK